MFTENKDYFDIEQTVTVMMNDQAICTVTLLSEPQYIDQELYARFAIDEKNLISFFVKFEPGLREQLCHNQKILYRDNLYHIESIDFGNDLDENILLLCYLPEEEK